MALTEEQLEELRNEFRILKRNAMYCVSKSAWMKAVSQLAQKLAGRRYPTPLQWVEAARNAQVTCPVCRGSGIYQWGACVNGSMTHSGPCFRCQAKGFMKDEDYRRNFGYDQYRQII